MTIDVDYELNWNKENIPIGGSLKKKAATFERNPSKRNILGELHEIIGEESSPKRGRNQSQSNIASIDEHDMEMEKQKWAKIALTLRCDKENNEEQLMEELLNLCSWYNDHEESTALAVMCRHSSYDAWDESSDEDDEDDAFMSYIRSQQFAFATSQTKNQQISLIRPKPIRSNSNESRLKSLHLKSRLSLFDSPPSLDSSNDNSVDANGPVRPYETFGVCNDQPMEKRVCIESNKKDDCSNSMMPPCSPSVAINHLTSSIERKSDNIFRESSSEILEKAFFGVVIDDNDISSQSTDQLTPTQIMFIDNESEKKSKEPQAYGTMQISPGDHDFWTDVDF